MNKIYRIFRNASGQWVVASELSRSHRKSSRRSSARFGARAAGIGVAALLGMSSQAFGACGLNAMGSYTSSVSCTPATGNADLTTQNGTRIDSSAHGEAGIQSISNDGNAKAIVQGTTITTSGPGASGIVIRANGTGEAAIELSDANSITLRGSAVPDTAVIASSLRGNASIDVSGELNISNESENSDARHGLEANAGGANALVSHMGSGTIRTLGGNAVLANGLGATTKATVNVGSELTLEVDNRVSGASGLTNAAIKVATKDGKALASSSASIKTQGDTALGMFVQATGSGDVVIENSGTIDTAGTGSHAILARANDAATTITNTGAIVTQGASSNGIDAGSASGSISIVNHSIIDVRGAGSSGIRAASSGGGNVDLTNSTAITTEGTNSSGIQAASRAGNLTIRSTGDITTRGTATDTSVASENWSHAIVGHTEEGGNVSITASRALATHADGANAIRAFSAGGDVSVNFNGSSSSIKTLAATGIAAQSDVGSVTVNNSGGISVAGPSSDGIRAQTSDGDARVTSTGRITTAGPGGIGIHASSFRGNAAIQAAGNIETLDNSTVVGTGAGSHGIYVLSSGGADKTASIEYGNAAGGITIHGSSDNDASMVSALRADTRGGANASVTVSNVGRIDVLGSNTAGIEVSGARSATGDLAVTFAAGTINAGTADSSMNADGIHAVNHGRGNVNVASRGNINVAGNAEGGASQGSEAILAEAKGDGNAAVQAGGILAVRGSRSGESAGIVAVTRGAGLASIEFQDAAGIVSTVAAAAPALKAAALGSGAASVQALAGRIVATGAGAHAVELMSPTSQGVEVGAGAELSGGWGDAAAIRLHGDTPAAVVTNAGSVGALSDIAIASDAMNGATLNIVNQAGGTITGGMKLGSGANVFGNAGTWNLRHLAGSDDSGARDTLRVAVADFGTGPNNAVDNSGTLALLGGTAAKMDAKGLYATGHDANTLTSGGAVQGQLLGVKTFNHSGLIDLGANPAVGDVLLISGGHAPGTGAGGVFVSNGGLVKIDTVLDEGGAHGRSDMLVVDSTQVGAGGATGIRVNNVGGAGGMSQGKGIEVVRVLEEGQSTDGAFVLDGRAVAGAYDYRLRKGSASDAADGNWYLLNTVDEEERKPDDDKKVDPKDQEKVSPDNLDNDRASPDGGPAIPMYRPEIGAYLGNQMAAVGMFTTTLHDRLGEVDFAERGRAAHDKPMAGWARVQGRKTDSEAGAGQLDMRTRAWVLQGGFELGRWNSGDNRFHAGLMFGTGGATTDVDSKITGYKATGRVDGNSVGAYGTWYADAESRTGLYVDSWMNFGRYDNEVQGQSLIREEYKSSTGAFSLEAGYAFEVSNNGERAILVEPQAQAIYTRYSADHHVEANGTLVMPDDAGGFMSRLGVRVYGYQLGQARTMQPFAEVNWWHADSDNSVTMNFERMEQGLPRDRYELKVGVQAELGGGWTGWSHVGFQTGSNYEDVNGQVGVKYTW